VKGITWRRWRSTQAGELDLRGSSESTRGAARLRGDPLHVRIKGDGTPEQFREIHDKKKTV